VPELPDLELYLEHLDRRLTGATLNGMRIANPFLLRTVEPPPSAFERRHCTGCRRLGKQLVLAFDGDFYAVVHLMIAGRLRWREPAARLPARIGLAAFDFDAGTLILTEAGSKRRAALRLVGGADALAALDPGGLEPLEVGFEAFRQRLVDSNHTLKRALTDQRVLAGIGNAYSDEILFAAHLSPFKRARDLDDEEARRLFEAMRRVLEAWRERLREAAGDDFPAKVTAFHDAMAVHGRYRQPCPACGAPVHRIRYAENEANYCAGCQTAGRLLADRSLSRLLKSNWPKRLEELE